MQHLVRIRAKIHKHPRAMEIRSLGCGPGVDQHGCGFDAIGLDADPVDPVPKGCEHLAADFPTVQLGLWVRGGGTCKCGAYLIDVITGHVAKLQVLV